VACFLQISAALLLAANGLAQTTLQRQIATIAGAAYGKVAVACSLPQSNLNCDLRAHSRPPMQSVFKLPLVLTTFHLIEQGKWTLDDRVRFRAADRILPRTVSPLQDKYPDAEVDVQLQELLRLAIVESDNVAADLILRNIGGPKIVERYIKSLGISGFHLQDNEAALHHQTALQYHNWFEPVGAVQLLRRLIDNPPCTQDHAALLLGWMKETPKGANRLKGQLPVGTPVMHKPGSSGTEQGLTSAWNDIGLITLPDGRRLAIAIFVSDSTANEVTRDAVIAQIAKAAFDTAMASPL
jgi:beta-lactamase class A